VPDVLAVTITRPDAWNFPLFVHLLGAFVLVGAVVLALASLAGAWTTGSAPMLRLAYRALSWVAIPAWVVMRLGAEWIADKEGLTGDNVDISWINIGYSIAEPTLLLLIIAATLARLGTKRSEAAAGTGAGFDKVATALVSVCLIAYLVAIWAMTTKPT
jgi:hypothetical protein